MGTGKPLPHDVPFSARSTVADWLAVVECLPYRAPEGAMEYQFRITTLRALLRRWRQFRSWVSIFTAHAFY